MGEEPSQYCIYFWAFIFHTLGPLWRTCFFLLCVFKASLKSLWNSVFYSGHHLHRLFSFSSFSSLLYCIFSWISELVAASFKFCCSFCVITYFNFRFHSLFEPKFGHFATALFSLNLASKRLEARRCLLVCWDLFPAILLLCLVSLEPPVFFFVLFRVSSARNLLLFFSHWNTSDLLAPCCFATV